MLNWKKRQNDMKRVGFQNVFEWNNLSIQRKYVWGFNYANLAERLTRLQQHIIFWRSYLVATTKNTRPSNISWKEGCKQSLNTPTTPAKCALPCGACRWCCQGHWEGRVAVSGSYHLPELRDKIKRCIMGKRGRIDRDHSKTVISNCAVQH